MRAASLLLTLFASAYATSNLESRSPHPHPQDDLWGEPPATVATDTSPAQSVGNTGSAPSVTANMPAMSGMSGLSPPGSGGDPHAGHDMSNMGSMPPPSSGSGNGEGSRKGTPKPIADAIKDLYDLLPIARAVQTVNLTPSLSPTNKRAKIRFGPFIIPGRGAERPTSTVLPSMDDDGVAYLSILKGGICSNCTVLTGKTGLELRNGTQADYNTGLYIHHLLMADITKPMALPVAVCDSPGRPGSSAEHSNTYSRLNGIVGSGFLGTGDNDGSSSTMFTTADGSYKSGYFIGKNDDFAITFDLVNENLTRQEVYVALDLEWVDGHVGSDAAKMVLSVAGCKSEPIKLNATGVATTRSRGYDVMADGDLIRAVGQMHEGGDHMALYLNNDKICDSVAKYGADDTGSDITEMSVCDKAIPVKKGDRLSLESVYDLGKHKLRRADSALLQSARGGYSVMALWELTFAMKGVNQKPW